MRTIALSTLLIALVAAPSARVDLSEEFSDAIERSFAPAGTVQLDLSAGDYRLRRGNDNRIRVAWHTRTADELSDTRVRLDVRGKEAEIHTSGPRNHFRVEIDLPGRSDLNLRMTAGDLWIAGIEGHKDISLRAGDLTIEVADPKQYKQVNASVTAGDLSAHPFGFSTGGLFRSFEHTGPGRYQLRASLWAGDVKLIAAKSER